MKALNSATKSQGLDFNVPSGESFDLTVAILQRCDEPTRDTVVCVSRTMNRACAEARRNVTRELARRVGRWTTEALPTMIELADMGCVRPNSINILRTLAPNSGPSHDSSSLLWFHQMRGRLDRAIERNEALHFRSEHRQIWVEDSDENRDPPAFLGCPLYNGFGRLRFPDNPDFFCEGRLNRSRLAGLGFGHRPSTCEAFEGVFWIRAMEGPGLRISRSGLRSEGTFVDDELEGLGTLRSPRGDHYAGHLVRGMPNGSGDLKLRCGTKLSGSWKAGFFESGIHPNIFTFLG